MRPAVAIFGPDPLLSVTIEARAGADELHVHPAGQGVWVARAVAALGGHPILCGLVGGETGTVVEGLLERAGIELRAAHTAGGSGSYVVDRRGGGRQMVATTARPAPGRHELDDLVALTCAAAFEAGVLVLCNPFPADGLPLDVYETVAAAARDGDLSLLVDLSSPRLEQVLPRHPDLVKLNDWELAEYALGPVEGARGLAAARRLCDAGARHVAVTHAGAPILVVPGVGDPFEIVPPEFSHGFR
jgi:1-phosphofructokinase